MKKTMISLLFVGVSLFALSGEEVYTQYCVVCHSRDKMMDMDTMKDMRQKMQNATKEEKQAMRQSMMKKNGMKAPAMPMVSMRVKYMTGSKEKFVSFVKDYIQNPSQEKGHCMPMAYKRFGVMPAIGKRMSEEKREVVAQWLYDNFKGSWGKSMGAKTCKNRNTNMKRSAN